MATHDLLLAVHVAAGSVALALGPVAICAERRPPHRSRAGSLYRWSVLAVALSALALVALDMAALS
jgi:Co/Zn/Cd efflux system component